MPDKKLLLCADLHLGRASAWLEGPASVDRTAVGAWRRIVDHAIGGQATAVVIAGDVFDGHEAYYETRHAFREGLQRLKAVSIPVVAVAGNHDWRALPAFARQYPDELILLGAGGRWETQSVAGITFLGWSFPAAAHSSRAFDTMPRVAGGEPVIGVVHGDMTPLSMYHPIAAADLSGGADAWVVGHIHQHMRIGATAVYPGSPQALDFGPGEMGAHGFVWLDFEGGKCRFSELVPVSTVLFHECSLAEVGVAPGDDLSEALEYAAREYCDGLLRAQPQVESIQVRLRATLRGAAAKPNTFPASPDTRFSWQFLDVALRDDRDPWAEAQGADAAAEVARLLLGALAEDGHYDERPVDANWIHASAALIDRGAVDVQQYWNRTIGTAADRTGESAPQVPTDGEARAIAREAVIAELWEMLRSVEARTEVAA